MINEDRPIHPFSYYLIHRKKRLDSQEVRAIQRKYFQYSQSWLKDPLWLLLEKYPELKDWLPHKNLKTKYTQFILQQLNELAFFEVLSRRISKLPVIHQDLQGLPKVRSTERLDMSGFHRHHFIPQYKIKELKTKYSNFPETALLNSLVNVPYLTPMAHAKAHEILFCQFKNMKDCASANLILKRLPEEYKQNPESVLGAEVLKKYIDAQREVGLRGIEVQKEKKLGRFDPVAQKKKSDMARNNPEALAKMQASGRKGDRAGKAKSGKNRAYEDSVALGLKGGRSSQEEKTIQSNKIYLFYRTREPFVNAFFENYNLPRDIAVELNKLVPDFHWDEKTKGRRVGFMVRTPTKSLYGWKAHLVKDLAEKTAIEQQGGFGPTTSMRPKFVYFRRQTRQN